MSFVLVAGVSVVVVATRENRIYSAEEKNWRRLQHSGIPTRAEIESLKRSEHGLTRGGTHGQKVHAVELALTVFDETGAWHPAALRTLVDEALLPKFCVAGTQVHLLRDPDDASVLAVDLRVRRLRFRLQAADRGFARLHRAESGGPEVHVF